MFKPFEETLTFDDVLLVPQLSDCLPADVALGTQLTPEISLNTPFISAPMDTVTEHRLAISLALFGGIGIIHKNLLPEEQVEEVKRVKRFENGFIENPVTVHPEDTIEKVVQLRREMGYKKMPVVEQKGKMVGFISDVDYFAPEDAKLMVKFRMQPLADLVTAQSGITLAQANKMIREQRLKTLCVLNKDGKLESIVTRKDIEKNELYPQAAKNDAKQLRVGAAVGVGAAGWARAELLIAAQADVIVVDTAHGHSVGVLKLVKELRKKYKDQQIIAGNIATAEGARALIEAGVNAVKVGIGPGSICTTRVIAGVGVPQLSAIVAVAKMIKTQKKKVMLIADGGIKTSGDIAKALAAGANTVMMGNMFAGTDESPGRVEYSEGRMFKVYRGMGSLEAMQRGSKDRYGQAAVSEKSKLVPEGVAGRVAYKGPIENILYQLAGGLRSGMGYLGARTIPELQKKAVFVKVSSAGLKESHPHDLRSISTAPNYNPEE